MLKNSKNLILAVALSLLAIVPCSYAQSANEISDFKLNSEKADSKSDFLSNNLFNNEFNLSLGSQILSYQNTNKVFSSETTKIETGFKGLTENVKLDDSEFNKDSQKDFASLITLNTSYEDNAIGLGDNSSQVFTLSGKTGRLSFYGKYNQSNLSISSGDNQTSENVVTSVRASSNNENTTSVIEENNNLSNLNNPSTISSDYYLEAVYSFKPNIKGKVAYKKTVIDTFDLKENVEVEGIVDVTDDVSIKASYLNENRPDIESKSSNEKKVLTEFILKF